MDSSELLKAWGEFHSHILLISGMAEDRMANSGVNALSSEITKHITCVKLPLLQLPKFSGNVLECLHSMTHLLRRLIRTRN